MKERERKGRWKSRFGVDGQGNGTEYKRNPEIEDEKSKGGKTANWKKDLENVAYINWKGLPKWSQRNKM